MKALAAAPRAAYRGFVLVVCLLMLIVMSLLAVAMFRSFTLQEQIAGNTREKQRALEAAESALLQAEWWLGSGTLGTMTGATCTANVANANNLATMKICSNALATPTQVPWPARWEFTPTYLTADAGGGLTTGGDVNYASLPSFYIQYLGPRPGGGWLYRIHAAGYGGSESSVAVIESVFAVSTATSGSLTGF